MSNQPAPVDLKFDIDSSVVFQLGESLISDDVQAIVELLKNAYDADALSAKVTIDTQRGPGDRSAFPKARGVITVEDNGAGMDLATIRDGWLFISNSPKRALKAAKGVTGKHRTPLGDKGLGRLSSQRLGENLEIFTRSASEDVEHYVAFSWSAFTSARRLSDVNVIYQPQSPKREAGTELVISGLRDIAAWEGKAAIERLETRLSELVSPFIPPQQFSVTALVDGQRIELARIADRIRRAANIQFVLRFDGSVLQVEGHVSREFFRPGRRATHEDRDAYEQLVEIDGGRSLAAFLAESRGAPAYNLGTGSEEWLLDFTIQIGLDDIQPKLLDGKPASPGPFHGEVDAFSLDTVSDSTDVFDAVSDLRTYVRELSGIRVYRDGFGIHVDRDWLKLSAQWISGRSWYTLRPESTIGFVALSARDNGCLEETTDREGFKVSNYYENFYNLLSTFIQRSSMVMEFFGRGWVEYRKAQHASAPSIKPLTTSELISTVRKTYSDSQRVSETVERVTQRVAQQIEATQAFGGATSTKDGRLDDHLDRLLSDLRALLTDSQQALRDAHQYLAEIGAQMPLVAELDSKVELLQQQLEQTHELVGLGITAEALSHEITAVVDQLQHRTREIVEHLERSEIRDKQLSSYFGHLTASMAALRKEIGHLAPAFRFARERREVVDVREFCKELANYHTGRMRRQRIRVSAELTDVPFRISINRGKLTQVFDNLILNSEYWLTEDIRLGRIKEGAIDLRVEAPRVSVADNGRGIDPLAEESLFEPFVTTKPKGVGRGLGLFIVRQLIESEGGTIQLLPQRNSQGRRYQFELDFKPLTRD